MLPHRRSLRSCRHSGTGLSVFAILAVRSRIASGLVLSGTSILSRCAMCSCTGCSVSMSAVSKVTGSCRECFPVGSGCRIQSKHRSDLRRHALCLLLRLQLPLNGSLGTRGRNILVFNLHRQSAALVKNLFQHPLQLTGLIAVDHGIFHRHMKKIRFWEGTCSFPEDRILYNTIFLQLCEQAVFVCR